MQRGSQQSRIESGKDGKEDTDEQKRAESSGETAYQAIRGLSCKEVVEEEEGQTEKEQQEVSRVMVSDPTDWHRNHSDKN